MGKLKKHNLTKDEEDRHNFKYNYHRGFNMVMGVSAALELVMKLWSDSTQTVGVEYVISDIESTILAHLHYPINNRNDKIPDNTPERSILADPSHTFKVVCK